MIIYNREIKTIKDTSIDKSIQIYAFQNGDASWDASRSNSSRFLQIREGERPSRHLASMSSLSDD